MNIYLGISRIWGLGKLIKVGLLLANGRVPAVE